MGELKASTRVILKNGEFPIPRSGVDRTAHVKDAYFEAVIQSSLRKTSRTETLLHPLKGLKIIVILDNSHFGADVPQAELAAEHRAPEISAGRLAEEFGVAALGKASW